MLVSVDVLLTEAPMSGDRTRFYRTCEKIRSSPYIEKILRAVRIMVRKYENGMVVFQTRIWCTGAFRLITRVFQWRWTNVSWGIFFTKVLVWTTCWCRDIYTYHGFSAHEASWVNFFGLPIKSYSGLRPLVYEKYTLKEPDSRLRPIELLGCENTKNKIK